MSSNSKITHLNTASTKVMKARTASFSAYWNERNGLSAPTCLHHDSYHLSAFANQQDLANWAHLQ